MRYCAPSQILEIDDQLTAFVLDSAVAGVRLEFENKRDVKRLESLVKSFDVLFTKILGGDVDRLLRNYADAAEDESEESTDADSKDVW